MNHRLIPALAVAALLAVGCGPAPIAVRGSLLIDEGTMGWQGKLGDRCETGGGYSDIHPGTAVAVTDASGATVALGALGDGTQDGAGHCRFPFTVADVPGGGDFYGVEVSHRGKVQFKSEQLREPVELTLGS